MNQNTEKLIGQFFINTSKDGKTTYLRGHVNGSKIVAFKSKDGKSFHVLPDTREPGEGDNKPQTKKSNGGYKNSTYDKKATAQVTGDDLF